MRPYPRFVAASGLTNLADGVAVVAWAWLASLLTRDALLVALVPVALRVPWFLFALPAGIVTDRVDRRRLIMAMDALRAGAFVLAAGGGMGGAAAGGGTDGGCVERVAIRRDPAGGADRGRGRGVP
ncbi:MAG: MFS transporter [Paracoccaceae bacterium]